MNAGDLKKEQQFRVVGWNEKLVLTVIYPIQDVGHQNIILCSMPKDKPLMNGYCVLAGRGEKIEGEFYEEMYALPIRAEVQVVS